MTELISLSPSDALLLALLCVLAGMVRGFSGFALSAVVMSLGVLILPPVELIPILWWQEITASILMVRGGLKEADKTVVIGLVGGSAVGLPFGLALMKSLPLETSKLVALSIIIVLAITQLARVRMAFLATKPGLWGSGVVAGIVAGLSQVGGMVVALYVLARDSAPRQMRASLVMYLFCSAVISILTLTLMGVMTQTAVIRGFALAPASALGVVIGKSLFRPAWEPYYKPFCLILLIVLACVALLRVLLS
ncbi:sulfite exporter TauE/SafE family protein [Thalassococcus lentus]|uniref:Probable membrane transporter protein n=1 Tax=Thalassococcus lentus TaxID=1210524 RepID=A0ABT4XMT0_9RHOB|nr:sulfite exporter TauE/SafE family protein [Thalassococcus lentus]MDA7423243.1 sulfite exporter TauE/SafE family protein [Thalassococcus lentus]